MFTFSWTCYIPGFPWFLANMSQKSWHIISFTCTRLDKRPKCKWCQASQANMKLFSFYSLQYSHKQNIHYSILQVKIRITKIQFSCLKLHTIWTRFNSKLIKTIGLLWQSQPLPGEGRNQDQRPKNLHNWKDYPKWKNNWKIFKMRQHYKEKGYYKRK